MWFALVPQGNSAEIQTLWYLLTGVESLDAIELIYRNNRDSSQHFHAEREVARADNLAPTTNLVLGPGERRISPPQHDAACQQAEHRRTQSPGDYGSSSPEPRLHPHRRRHSDHSQSWSLAALRRHLRLSRCELSLRASQ